VAQHFVAAYGWRATYIGIGVFCGLSLTALALLFRRRPPRSMRSLRLRPGAVRKALRASSLRAAASWGDRSA
jgi:hypothetical protein